MSGFQAKLMDFFVIFFSFFLLHKQVSLSYLLVGKELLAKTEVRQDDMTLGIQQDVFQLDITVDNTQLERKGQTTGHPR